MGVKHGLHTAKTAGTVSHKGTAHDHGHSLVGQSDKQEILDRVGSTSINSMLLKAQLRWTGHVIRMTDSRKPRQLLYSELLQGSRKHERPKLRFKNTMKSELKWSGTCPRELEASAADRSEWRSLTSRTAAAFEEDRRQRLAAARDRHHRAVSASIQTTDYRCETRGRQCAFSFGLRGHMRSHRWKHRLSSSDTDGLSRVASLLRTLFITLKLLKLGWERERQDKTRQDKTRQDKTNSLFPRVVNKHTSAFLHSALAQRGTNLLRIHIANTK